MKKLTFILLAALLITLPVSQLMAASDKSIALVMKVTGDVQIKKAGTSKTGQLTFGTTLDNGDWIRTGTDGKVKLIFTDDKSLINLNPNTEVTINGTRDDQANIAKRVNMEVGEIFAKVAKQRGTLEIATPTSVASVKGTDFWVVVDEDGTTYVVTLDGLVELLNRLTGQTVQVSQGQTGESGVDGGVEVTITHEDGVPEGGDDEEPPKVIQLNLQGPAGQTKTIKIEYRDQDDN
jgi:hypothetical protein